MCVKNRRKKHHRQESFNENLIIMDQLEAISRLAEECLQLKLDNVAEEVEDLSVSMVPSKDEIKLKLRMIQNNLPSVEKVWQGSDSVSFKAKQLLVPLILLLGEQQDGAKPWSSEELSDTVKAVATDLCLIISGKPCVAMETARVEEILINDIETDGSSRRSLFFLCLQHVRKRVKADVWKYHPAAVTAFSWLVQQMKSPYLSDFCGSIFSACLLLVDDYNCENKILGLELLEYTMKNVNKTDLVEENWAMVIYNALMGLVHDSSPDVIQRVVPLIFQVLKVIEVDPNVNSHKFTKFDDAMKKILFALETCSGNAVKIVWVRQITNFIQILGHATLHWRDRIYGALLPLTVICEKDLWMDIVDCTQVCIKNTWIKPNSTSAAEIIFRIIFNCAVLDVPNTNSTDREEIIRQCCNALELMSHCSDFEDVKTQLEEMKANSKFHPKFLDALKNLNL